MPPPQFPMTVPHPCKLHRPGRQPGHDLPRVVIGSESQRPRRGLFTLSGMERVERSERFERTDASSSGLIWRMSSSSTLTPISLAQPLSIVCVQVRRLPASGMRDKDRLTFGRAFSAVFVLRDLPYHALRSVPTESHSRPDLGFKRNRDILHWILTYVLCWQGNEQYEAYSS